MQSQDLWTYRFSKAYYEILLEPKTLTFSKCTIDWTPFPVTDLSPLLFFNSVDFSPSCLFEKITNYVKGLAFYNTIITGHSSVVAKLMFQPGIKSFEKLQL